MEDPDPFLDKKWRISKKNEKRSSKSSSYSSSSSSTYSLSKSSSVRINHHSSPPHGGLRRSSSTSHPYSPHSGNGGFTRKCKEHKARFYIMKRCVAMLVRWRKHRDDDDS